MTSIDTKIKEQIDAFVPPVRESYTQMFEDTVAELRSKAAQASKRGNNSGRSIIAIAATVTALLIGSAVVFSTSPALAAEVPWISGIVYAVYPQKAVNDHDRERIEALLDDAFRFLSFCDYEAAAHCFHGGSIRNRQGP